MSPEQPGDLFFDRPAPAVARDLIGWVLAVNGVGGTIAETEAYTGDDEASHSFRGKRVANAAMFGPPGTVYVYRSYGLHICLNIVCADAGAVLLRALVPEQGREAMARRRGTDDSRLWCSGPGRLGQAIGIDLSFNQRPVGCPPFDLRPGRTEGIVIVGPRIGISRAKDRPWRFGLSGSRFLSKPFSPPFHESEHRKDLSDEHSPDQ